jgi:hypothetical protein
MKTTILLISILLFVSSIKSQEVLKDVPKNTNKIIIDTNQNQDENYKQALNILLDNDFEIGERDSDLFTIKTGLKPLPRTGQYYLNLRCKDNQIIITGKFYSGITLEIYDVDIEDSIETIVNKGMKGSVYKNAFLEMFKAAKLFGNNLTYK